MSVISNSSCLQQIWRQFSNSVKKHFLSILELQLAFMLLKPGKARRHAVLCTFAELTQLAYILFLTLADSKSRRCCDTVSVNEFTSACMYKDNKVTNECNIKKNQMNRCPPRQKFSKFPRVSLIKIKFPWPTKYKCYICSSGLQLQSLPFLSAHLFKTDSFSTNWSSQWLEMFFCRLQWY